MRVVLDANVFISALLSRSGPPAQLVERWLAGEFDLVVSELLLTEVARILDAPKLSARISTDDRIGLVTLLRELAETVADPEGAPPLRSADPDDDYLLALAAHQGAVLVTGDAHLLALAHRAPVYAPREFLAQLEG